MTMYLNITFLHNHFSTLITKIKFSNKNTSAVSKTRFKWNLWHLMFSRNGHILSYMNVPKFPTCLWSLTLKAVYKDNTTTSVEVFRFFSYSHWTNWPNCFSGFMNKFVSMLLLQFHANLVGLGPQNHESRSLLNQWLFQKQMMPDNA